MGCMEVKAERDMGDEPETPKEGKDSTGAVIVETLLNIRTVASLCIQDMKSKEYSKALASENVGLVKANLKKGIGSGLGLAVNTWANGVLFYAGSKLLSKTEFNSPKDFNASSLSIMFALTFVSGAIVELADQFKAKEAAERIFGLIDKKCEIDALSEEGKKQV